MYHSLYRANAIFVQVNSSISIWAHIYLHKFKNSFEIPSRFRLSKIYTGNAVAIRGNFVLTHLYWSFFLVLFGNWMTWKSVPYWFAVTSLQSSSQKTMRSFQIILSLSVHQTHWSEKKAQTRPCSSCRWSSHILHFCMFELFYITSCRTIILLQINWCANHELNRLWEALYKLFNYLGRIMWRTWVWGLMYRTNTLAVGLLWL